MECNKILVVDDEPEYLTFLFDYFDSCNLETVIATNLSQAIEISEKYRYKLALVDMNIPAVGNAQSLLDNPIAKKYPGFKVAHHLRNKGYGAHQVIVYTVHDDNALDSEIEKIRCRYVLKGRPDILKSIVTKSLGEKPED
jgi:CheY-like chemotaxis protein